MDELLHFYIIGWLIGANTVKANVWEIANEQPGDRWRLPVLIFKVFCDLIAFEGP